MGHTNDRSTKASSLVNPTSLNLQPRPFAPLESDEKDEAISHKSGYSENFLEKIINTPRSESATPIQRKPENRLKAIATERNNASLQNQSIQRQEAAEDEKSEGEQEGGKEFIMNPEPPPVQRKFENRLRAKNAQRMAIQTKLAIGEPNDKYEQEADATASSIVQQINSSTTSQSQPVQRQELEEDELQMKPLVQRSENLGGGEASTDFESTINSARGGGQPFDPGLQRSMGQAMGADFSGVKVHTDTQADQLNQSIQAKAFTTGQDVFFRQGEYNPGSRGGQELIAHEMTHVVQQKGAAQAPSSNSEYRHGEDHREGAVARSRIVGIAPENLIMMTRIIPRDTLKENNIVHGEIETDDYTDEELEDLYSRLDKKRESLDGSSVDNEALQGAITEITSALYTELLTRYGEIPSISQFKLTTLSADMVYYTTPDGNWHFTYFIKTKDYHLKGNNSRFKGYQEGYFKGIYEVITKVGKKNANAEVQGKGHALYEECVSKLLPDITQRLHYMT